MKFIKAVFIFLFLSLNVHGLHIPDKPNSRVVDLANLLTYNEKVNLEQKLNNIYQIASGTEVQLLTIPKLAGNNLEDLSLNIARKWKLGQKGVNNGLLIVVAKHEREVFIAVGYGLEGIFPDGYLGRLEDSILVPNFKAGKFYIGLNQLVDELSIKIIKEYKGAKKPDLVSQIMEYWMLGLLIVILFVLIIIGRSDLAFYIIMLIFNRRGGGGNPPDVGKGGGFGGGGTKRKW